MITIAPPNTFAHFKNPNGTTSMLPVIGINAEGLPLVPHHPSGRLIQPQEYANGQGCEFVEVAYQDSVDPIVHVHWLDEHERPSIQFTGEDETERISGWAILASGNSYPITVSLGGVPIVNDDGGWQALG